jgi:hypothetical protein
MILDMCDNRRKKMTRSKTKNEGGAEGGEIFLEADTAGYSTCRRQHITIESR